MDCPEQVAYYILHLLDDFLIISPSNEACQHQLGTFLMLCSFLGITMALLAHRQRAALKHGIRNPETESRKRKRKQKKKRNTESNINDRKLKNFTLHNLVQSKENLS